MEFPQSVQVCEDNPGAVWILAHASFDGQTTFGIRGMLLICVDTMTGQTQWRKQFCRALNPRSYQSYGLVKILRFDCNGDGVADAIVPDGDDRSQVELAAISGSDGESLWKVKTELTVDRWEAGVAWPPIEVCGPESDRRILLFDGNNKTQSKHTLRMLSASNGSQVDDHPITVEKAYRRLTNQSGRFEINVVNPNTDWPRVCVAYPSKIGTKTWQEYDTSEAGFALSEILSIEQKAY